MGALAQQGADVDPDALFRRIALLESNPTLRGMSISARRAFKAITPARSSFRAVMASPPTTTFTTSGTIASSIYWPSTTQQGSAATYEIGGSFFSYGRTGGPVQHGITSPDYFCVGFTSVNYGAGLKASNINMASFMHDGAAIEISIKGETGAFLCKVDDQFITLTPQVVPNDGSLYRFYIPFGSTKKRRIDFIFYNSAWSGVYTAATDSIEPAPLRGPRCIVMGDSFTEGTGSNNVDSWVNIFAEAMGWDDVWPSGVGGSGYLTTGGGNKLKYRDRFATDVTPWNPDVVMFTGGINDNGGFTAAQVGAEALLLFQQAQASLPNALLVAVAPFWKGGPSTVQANVSAMKDAIKSAIQSVGGIFIDPLEQPLPLNYTPLVTVLTTQASAGASTISMAAVPNIRSTFKFADGTRFQVKTVAGTGPFSVGIDGTLLNAQANGAVITQVGDCFWTGTGRVGTTSGYGNSDLYVSADATHPTVAGHSALGQCVASLLIAALS